MNYKRAQASRVPEASPGPHGAPGISLSSGDVGDSSRNNPPRNHILHQYRQEAGSIILLPESGSPPGEVEEKPAGSLAATEDQVSGLFLQLCTWSDFWAMNFHHLLQTSSMLPSPEMHLFQMRPETPDEWCLSSPISPPRLPSFWMALCPPQITGLLRLHLVSGRFRTERRVRASPDLQHLEGKDEAGTLSTHTPCEGALTAGTSRKVSGKENSPPSCSRWK